MGGRFCDGCAHVACLHAGGVQGKLIEFVQMLCRLSIELGAIGVFVLLLRVRYANTQRLSALPLLSSFVVLLTAALHWLLIITAYLAVC